jgi:hypothetical protein
MGAFNCAIEPLAAPLLFLLLRTVNRCLSVKFLTTIGQASARSRAVQDRSGAASSAAWLGRRISLLALLLVWAAEYNGSAHCYHDGRRDLTARLVERLKGPGRYHDGFTGGLYLQVTESGAKSWLFRFQLNNSKQRGMGLGPYPATPMPPTDPLIYRFYELVMVNGPASKSEQALLNEVPHRGTDPKGDRVKLTMSGKFLPYKYYGATGNAQTYGNKEE